MTQKYVISNSYTMDKREVWRFVFMVLNTRILYRSRALASDLCKIQVFKTMKNLHTSQISMV